MNPFETKFIQAQALPAKQKKQEMLQVDQADSRKERSLTENADTERTLEITESGINGDLKIEDAHKQIMAQDKSVQIQSFRDALLNKAGYIDFNQLQMIGHGGTHDVFLDPKNPKFVIKVNRSVLEKVLNIGRAGLSPDTIQMLDRYVTEENNKNEQLYKYFGQNHCLRAKTMIQKISIEKGGTIKNIEVAISIQEASDIFQNLNKKDFSTCYIEQSPLILEKKSIYDRMNRALLGKGEFREEDFLEFNDKLRSIFKLIDTDTEFANSIKEFLLRFKNYFNASGRFVDLVGQENVLFYKDAGKWTFKLGSVVKEETNAVMKKALKILEQNPEILNNDEEMRNQLMNQLALVRLLNATGLKVGIGKIIDIQLSSKQIANLDKINFKK